MSTSTGFELGEVCNRPHKEGLCKGVIAERESYYDGCGCHINPPCDFCTEDRALCPVCGWEAE